MGIDNLKPAAVPITTPDHVGLARKLVQERAIALGFKTLERTKFVTAASELARNTLVHGGGGQMRLSVLVVDGRTGLRLEFRDEGQGIPDINLALTDGFTTASSLGLGLGGAKRLVNQFEIESQPGAGTVVCITQWKRR